MKTITTTNAKTTKANTGKAGVTVAVQTQTQTAPDITTALPKFRTVYRIQNYYTSGSGLWSYTIAVLTVLGGFSAKRGLMRISDFKSFYNSPTAFTYHVNTTGYFAKEEGRAGYFRLSVAGFEYFAGRMNGKTSNQAVLDTDVITIVAALLTGKFPQQTTHYKADTKMSAVTIANVE